MVPKKNVAVGFDGRSQCRAVVWNRVESSIAPTGVDDREIINCTRRDEVGSQKGKRLELSIWAWPHYQPVWLGQKPLEEGFDIKAWIKEGLLDSLVCKRDVDQEYLKLCKAHNCTYYQYPGGGALEESPETTSKMYKAGARYFADWDTDFAHIHPETWAWQSRVGHRQEMENWNAEAHKIKSVGLRKVDGVDVSIDLERTVYSGG